MAEKVLYFYYLFGSLSLSNIFSKSPGAHNNYLSLGGSSAVRVEYMLEVSWGLTGIIIHQVGPPRYLSNRYSSRVNLAQLKNNV